jgi:hypothetical protein
VGIRQPAPAIGSDWSGRGPSEPHGDRDGSAQPRVADTIRLPARGSLLLASVYQADGADQLQARKRPSAGGSFAAPLARYLHRSAFEKQGSGRNES